MRMKSDLLPSCVYNNWQPGSRARGRPRTRWIDKITDIVEHQRLATTDAAHLTHNRKLKLLMKLHCTCG
uniref:Uncharacterized protein n=1 Tax=Arion vulgaris TaxID=1028688 RepID=A0A0B7BQR4_9EUPU